VGNWRKSTLFLECCRAINHPLFSTFWRVRLSSIIAVALASGMVSAMATNFAIGSLPIAPTVYSNVVSGLTAGSFSDWYSFTFPSLATTGSGSAITIDVQNLLHISNFTLQLYDGVPLNKLADGVTTGASAVLFNYPYMDAPGLPSSQFMTTRR